jgi:tRNA (guanine10-N2)-methyltransferase
MVFGSDIDGRQMRGKGELLLLLYALTCQSFFLSEKIPGVIRAATQYGVASRILGLSTFDVTRNPWRCGELFDAIVTDPPCRRPFKSF